MATKKRERTSELPELIKDPVLGTLRFSAALDDTDEYQTKLVLDGSRVTIDLYTDTTGSLNPCIVRARRIVERFPAIQKKMHRYIEREIFPNYNKTWRADKKPFTMDQILRRLKLRMVTAHPGPEATFWFDAGDLFFAHALILRMGDRNKFVGYDMPG